MTWKIPLFKIYWDYDDVKSVTEVIESGEFWTTGKNVPEFERDIAHFLGRKYALAFSSGTAALHASLLSYGVESNDQVIVPSFTFIATANAPFFVGAQPVFADIEKRTFGIDSLSLLKNITPKTKAIVPVHYGGCPCLINKIRKIADDNNLLLIEDAAESLGASICDKKVGTFGDSAILSFCQNKIITTGEGGAIVTDSEEVYEKLKLIRSHGREENRNYFSSSEYMDYVSLGYNFRMSSITAALGISQLRKIQKITDLRRENAKYMTEELEKIKEVNVPHPPKGFYNVYQLYTILVRADVRDKLMNYLSEKGIMTKVYFYPVHLTKFYKDKRFATNLPTTEAVANQALTLPMYPALKKEEIDFIVSEIKNFFLMYNR